MLQRVEDPIGAGVDALLQLRLPPTTQVVRLDDAGMSVQMAEYVCHALIRHFREFDLYAADMGAGQWSFHKPLQRTDFPVGVMGLLLQHNVKFDVKDEDLDKVFNW